MTTSSRHEWLRRVSDYHDGASSDDERVAVENHLKTCTECQEALTLYRRFYALLRSPLRLGGPTAAFSEDTPTVVTPVSIPEHGHPSYQQPRPRRKLVTGIAAGLVAALVVAGFLAALASRGSGSSVAATAVPGHTATAASQPTNTAAATPGTTTTPTPSAFVCANPAGSQMVYAYVRGDGNMYVVKGCALSGRIAGSAPYAHPVAWSPSNQYLMVDEPQSQGGDQVFAIDTVSGQRYVTDFSQDYGTGASPGDTAHIFIGWLDDYSFLGVNVPITQQATSGAPIGPMTVVKVDLFNRKQFAVTKITWAASFAVRDNGKYLFYSGYQSAGEGGAYLHRIDLTTGTDTKLVPLGIAGPGPCQGTPVCPWTAPWDVTADGAHVFYHNPGPTSTPNDTNIPTDTPLFYANVDGSGATKPFGSKLASGLTTPVLSPDGRYVVASGSNYTPNQFGQSQIGFAQISGGYQIINGNFQAWRSDSQAMVLQSNDGSLMLYTVGDTTTRKLEANASSYVWGN